MGFLSFVLSSDIRMKIENENMERKITPVFN